MPKDVADLESKIRDAIVKGQPKINRPWKKIFIIVEGIFSMEGSIVKLPAIISLKKKYKCYLYLDEAHSIGAIGDHGRGVLELFKCNPQDVDILMGTFTKSFGSVGGYIAGSKQLIDHIRANSHCTVYGASMSPPIAMQTIATISSIMGRGFSNDGHKRIKRLHWNTLYFRHELLKRGFILYGNRESPIVPLIIFHPFKSAVFSESLLKRGIAIVVVGPPATPLQTCRARFCISANHTKAMLDKVIKAIDEVGDEMKLKHSRMPSYIIRELEQGQPGPEPID